LGFTSMQPAIYLTLSGMKARASHFTDRLLPYLDWLFPQSEGENVQAGIDVPIHLSPTVMAKMDSLCQRLRNYYTTSGAFLRSASRIYQLYNFVSLCSLALSELD
jgi:hypothetical protein